MHFPSELPPVTVLNTEYIDFCQRIYATQLKSSTDLELRAKFLHYVADVMVRNVSEYFSSGWLEDELNQLSRCLAIEPEQSWDAGSTLHVMTEAYDTGGHTQLLIRWIENQPPNGAHSVVLTSPEAPVPDSLARVVKAQGEVFHLHERSWVRKAKELARLASRFEQVILHIHPNDIVANLAFAHERFTRPVGFMNHADHMFACGFSVANVVFELSEEGVCFSQKYRGVKNNHSINIPIVPHDQSFAGDAAKQVLGLPDDARVVLSIATEYKYGDGEDFVRMAHRIVDLAPNVFFVLVGPSCEKAVWREAKERSNGRILPMGRVEREKLTQYIASADLYIESFPFGSYTAFLEVAAYGVPLLRLKTPIHSLDVVRGSAGDCASVDEIVQKAALVLSDQNTERNRDYILNLARHYPEQWFLRCQSVLQNYLVAQTTPYHLETVRADPKYVNFMSRVVRSQMSFGKAYKHLPIRLKWLLFKKLHALNLLGGRGVKALYRSLLPF